MITIILTTTINSITTVSIIKTKGVTKMYDNPHERPAVTCHKCNDREVELDLIQHHINEITQKIQAFNKTLREEWLRTSQEDLHEQIEQCVEEGYSEAMEEIKTEMVECDVCGKYSRSQSKTMFSL